MSRSRRTADSGGSSKKPATEGLVPILRRERQGRRFDIGFKKRQHLHTADGNQCQVDEVEVFEMFGGDLPVCHRHRNHAVENNEATCWTMHMNEVMLSTALIRGAGEKLEREQKRSVHF